MANSSQSITFLTISATLARSLSRSSVSEVTAETSSRKSSSSERSRKRTADLRGLAMGSREELLGRFNDLYAGAGADARRARRRHVLQIFQRPDTARRLDAHLGSYHHPHQRDIVRRRAARTEAGGCLHKIRPGQLRQRA